MIHKLMKGRANFIIFPETREIVSNFKMFIIYSMKRGIVNVRGIPQWLIANKNYLHGALIMKRCFFISFFLHTLIIFFRFFSVSKIKHS